MLSIGDLAKPSLIGQSSGFVTVYNQPMNQFGSSYKLKITDKIGVNEIVLVIQVKGVIIQVLTKKTTGYCWTSMLEKI